MRPTPLSISRRVEASASHRLRAAGLAAFVLLPALAWSSGAADPKKELPPFNRDVVKFARERLGKKVGDGDCTTLAVESLKSAGARSYPSQGGLDTDYEWGERVATLTPEDHPTADILPGDVVQLRDVTLVTVTRSRSAIRTVTMTYDHHTAIVSQVSGRAIKVLQQNVGPGKSEEKKRIVQEATLRLDDLKKGTLWVYRPVAE